MMDEQLRDNVERLLQGRTERPSPEFAARIESLIRPEPRARKDRKMVRLSAAAAAAALLLILWIGKQGSGPSPAPAPAPAPAVQGEGVVRGTVILRGLPPKSQKISVSPYVNKSPNPHPSGLEIFPVEVDGANHVRSCLVYVKKGLEGKSFQPPAEHKSLVFDRFQLLPRMTGIMVGQPIVVETRDKEFHNIHFMPFHNKETNVGLGEEERTYRRTFTEPELPIKAKCDVHPWEGAWLAVLPHPFYAVTDERGRFELPSLPPGKYTIEVWQKYCISATQEIEIQPQKPLTIDFTLSLRAPKVDDVWEEAKHGPHLGKIIEVDALFDVMPATYRPSPPLPQGKVWGKLTVGDKAGLCAFDPAAGERLKNLPAHAYVVVRGVFRGRVGSEPALFVMDDCEIAEAGDLKFGK
jgi:hypothetical protein